MKTQDHYYRATITKLPREHVEYWHEHDYRDIERTVESLYIGGVDAVTLEMITKQEIEQAKCKT